MVSEEYNQWKICYFYGLYKECIIINLLHVASSRSYFFCVTNNAERFSSPRLSRSGALLLQKPQNFLSCSKRQSQFLKYVPSSKGKKRALYIVVLCVILCLFRVGMRACVRPFQLSNHSTAIKLTMHTSLQ
jgi:hypothetical protein